MRMTVVAMFLATLLAPTLTKAVDAAPPDLKTTFEGRYATMKSAMAARDSKLISALLAQGFESVDVDGRSESADQMIQDLLALPVDPKKISDTTVISAVRQGNVAIVVQRYHMTTAKPGPDGSTTRNIELVTTSTDTWVESEGAWLLKQTRTNEMSYSIDGKLITHKGHPPKR